MSLPLAQRVLLRWAASKEIPVKNKETGRVVYVLPETFKNDPEKFETLSPNEDPQQKRTPSRSKKPRKPERSEIPRDAPPAPIKPPRPPKRKKRPKLPKRVPMLKGPKVPEPSPFRRWKVENRFQASLRVAARWAKHAGI